MIPEWLIIKNQEKKEMEAEKKIKKLYYHNISILKWEKDFYGQNISGMGMITE